MIPLDKGLRGQMTVEMCVVLPAAIAVAVIVVNAVTFFGYCSEFDRVARNAVRVAASTPASHAERGSIEAEVKKQIERVLDASNLSCEVESSSDYRGLSTYKTILNYRPTLFGLGLRSSVFGVSLPPLSHTAMLTVDPYRPGEIL